MGAWTNYEQLEDELTLDELLLTYEAASTRQERLMKTVAAAMGADVSGEGDKFDGETTSVANINLDQGPQIVSQDDISGIKSEDNKVSYQSGDIKVGKTGVFGYSQVDNLDDG